jgi:hypothetical protein
MTVKECELARLIEALESMNLGDAEGNELESMFKLVVFYIPRTKRATTQRL